MDITFRSLIMFAVFNRFNPSYEEAARILEQPHGKPSGVWFSLSLLPRWWVLRYLGSPSAMTSSPALLRHLER